MRRNLKVCFKQRRISSNVTRCIMQILAGKALAPFDNAIGLWKSLKTARSSYFRLNESLKNYVEEKGKIEGKEEKEKTLT